MKGIIQYKKDNSMTRQKNTDHIAKEKQSNIITARIKLGMPNKDCAYSGICKIEPEESQERIEGKCYCLARISLTEKKTIFFQFQKDQMEPDTLKKHFGSGYFVILESYRIPEFVCEAFNIRNLVIGQGVYQVKEKKKCLEVAIAIQRF